MSISEAQRRASAKWVNKNRERKNYIIKRSTTRSFIKNLSTLEDLEELKRLIKAREVFLKN